VFILLYNLKMWIVLAFIFLCLLAKAFPHVTLNTEIDEREIA